jgi:hypothetical protein
MFLCRRIPLGAHKKSGWEVVSMDPFKIAERYIKLREKFESPSWGDRILRVNEMILTPLISLFLFFLRKSDLFGLISSATMVYKAWSEWTEYWTLRFAIQGMMFTTLCAGGPFIVTNDPTYMPYVWADGVTRTASQRCRA